MNRHCILTLIPLASVSFAANAAADSPNLKGAYAFTGTAACLVSASGFNGRLQALGIPFSRSFSVEGIRTFDGNGNGTVKGTTVGIVAPPTPGFVPSASSADFTFNFTYVVNPDSSWTAAMVPGTYTETITAGPRAGQTATVDAIPPVSGVISSDGKTLIAAHITPTIETYTFSNGDIEPAICHRSRVFIKLRGSNNDPDQDH